MQRVKKIPEPEMGEITRLFAQFVVKTDYEQMPADVIHATKRFILDMLTAIEGGHFSEKGKICVELVDQIGGSAQSTVLGTPKRTSVPMAAFANAELANGLDIDESFMNGGHQGITTFPSTLAMAEYCKISGKELIVATAIGYDVASRFSVATSLGQRIRVVGEQGTFRVEQNPSFSFAHHILGAAAGAARCHHLSYEQTADALGIAGFSAPIPTHNKWRRLKPTPLLKYAAVGSMAASADIAVLQASLGFTGDRSILDGDNGFWKMAGATTCDWRLLTEELGRKWWITQSAPKFWPTGNSVHHPLTCFTKIMNERHLAPDEIESVRVYSDAIGRATLSRIPKSLVDTPFSVQYALALAALNVKPGPKWQSNEVFDDPRVRDFMERVEVEVNPESDEKLHEELDFNKGQLRRNATRVDVNARGNTYSESTAYAKGNPWSEATKLTDEEMKEKFRSYATGILSSAKIEKVIETVYGIEDIEDVSELIESLCP